MLCRVINSPVTRGAEVYDVLRAELLNGVLCPGEKLRMVELARRFSVSQSVVREALTRLAEQGLVVAKPQRGFRVRELSVEDIVGLTESRVEIESVALRLAIERGDVLWETQIVAAHHLLERTPVVDADGRFHEPWAAVDHDFHRSLTEGCNNARLQDVVLALRDSAGRRTSPAEGFDLGPRRRRRHRGSDVPHQRSPGTTDRLCS
jgi:DNA-binding GntR family transcriptional regulator